MIREVLLDLKQEAFKEMEILFDAAFGDDGMLDSDFKRVEVAMGMHTMCCRELAILGDPPQQPLDLAILDEAMQELRAALVPEMADGRNVASALRLLGIFRGRAAMADAPTPANVPVPEPQAAAVPVEETPPTDLAITDAGCVPCSEVEAEVLRCHLMFMTRKKAKKCFEDYVSVELRKAREHYAAFAYPSQAYDVMRRIFDEVHAEILKGRFDFNAPMMLFKAVQLAAMARRLAEDVLFPRLIPSETPPPGDAAGKGGDA